MNTPRWMTRYVATVPRVVMISALLGAVSGLVDAQELTRGPFDRLVIRGVTLIDGTGAPPTAPVDIVIEGDRITQLRTVGNDFGEIDEEGRPESGDLDIDGRGMYVMPGFVDAHVHIRRERSTHVKLARLATVIRPKSA